MGDRGKMTSLLMWVCHFPPSPWTPDGGCYILALFSPYGNTRGNDTTKTKVTYNIINRSKFVAATTIESVVGHVLYKQSQDVKNGRLLTGVAHMQALC